MTTHAEIAIQTQLHPLDSMRPRASRGRLATAGLWILQIVAAGMFLMVGTPKLTGDPAMVQLFEAIGLGQSFRYVTGTIEVVSALFLLVPSFAAVAALALAATMVGAIATQVFIVDASPALPIALLAVTGTIAWARRDTFQRN